MASQTKAPPLNAENLFAEGAIALETGDLKLAEEKLLECLRLAPNLVSAKRSLAIVYTLKADSLVLRCKLDDALSNYDHALSLCPDLFEAWFNRGNTLRDLGRLEEALASYEYVIKLRPELVEAILNRGVILNDLSRYEEALKNYALAIELRPNQAELWSNRGNTFSHLKRQLDALVNYNRAIELNPELVQVWSNRGTVLSDLGRYEEALVSYDRAIELNPKFAEAWNNRGITLNDFKRQEEALVSYDRAIELNPKLAEAWNNRGVTLNDLKRHKEALASYDHAIELNPKYAEAWSNRGVTLSSLKRHQDALDSYNEAIELQHDYAEAWSGRGITLNALKRYEEALTSYERSLAIKPDADFFLGDLVHTQMKICDWTSLRQRRQTLKEKISFGGRASTPFVVLSLFDDPQLHQHCAEIYSNYKFGLTGQLGTITRKTAAKKIRVGYFSMDFHDHPISHLLVELIERHDRSHFEIYGFSFGMNTTDPIRQRLKNAFDNFFDLKSLGDVDITRFAREQGVDIAIDLGGYTQDSRPQIFANRAAPIQINYLGFPGTMGSNFMDYFIGDQKTITDENLEYFSEKIIFLPSSFQPNPSLRPVTKDGLLRKDYCLPDSVFVFCCFNNAWKITPKVFESWARILNNVEDSILWLSQANPTSTINIMEEFKSKGIRTSRIIFAERLPDLSDHLARYQSADLFLDTFPYGAHTTASDALWTGLPVLTLSGKSFASRVASSLLHTIGLPELITTTHEDFESLAIELAVTPAKLGAIKTKLVENRSSTPLFNTQIFAKHIEAGYKAAYDRYNAGLSPDHIYVSP